MLRKITTLAALVGVVRGQAACSLTAETHPSLTWQKCSSGGSCSNVAGSVTIDANWRWTHTTSGYTNCYTGNKWDTSICSTNDDCASKCCVDGANYQQTYGASTSGNALTLQYVTQSSGKNVGSRLYLLESENKYQMFNLLGNEFTFDVDASKLGCGLNGAVYFVSMDADGGQSKYSGNKAGAKYGTGYCDSQCPRDLKYINGAANVEGWTSSTGDANSGVGNIGSCCAEMDIWEANSISTAYTPHPCSNNAQHACKGDDCGGTYSSTRYAGDCDPDGCDFNSYRQGNRTFYGPGSNFNVDSSKKVTVVTQFISSGGQLTDIKRFYVQNGKVIPNSQSTITGVTGNSVTQDYCDKQKTAFGDQNVFNQRGGLRQMGDALAKGMVLVMSVWDDHNSNMLWLDSTYPTDSTAPGAARGSCSTSSGKPADVQSQTPGATVVYSNIKFGPIGSTFKAS
ncbi:hypothetical protein PpBr36_07302 [Pyricularia pennisetigena]|uniref:hypothetical protein n=1 Tax=Pyricularia pennisetigena TaxID=1578925 RepID=UPI001154C28E|nr:hypothetical protein PpBr36_07302 [Pyricularia pennisetigena]TLS25417.1 hypothetical protein PpBr36_07302 [Pyricularia pennisetigena]